MFKLFWVTDRTLCPGDFLSRLEAIAKARPDGIILREKDLAPEDYRALAEKALAVSARYDVPCILHTFAGAARDLGAHALHLPLPALTALDQGTRRAFPVLGASCHSVEDAVLARSLGCTYITAGHVFDTDCKRGLPGRGLDFLEQVCQAVSLPVYAIGGIAAGNLAAVRAAGAAGACFRSGPMLCADPADYFAQLRRSL